MANYNTALIKEAIAAEDEALYLKKKHIRGDDSVKPRDIGVMYERGGDRRRQARDWIGAESSYREAMKYGFFYSKDDQERINKKLQSIQTEKIAQSFRTKPQGLQKVVASIAIISLAGALLSISMNLTGNVIGGSLDNNRWISIGLFFLGCALTLFYFQAKKRNVKTKSKKKKK